MQVLIRRIGNSQGVILPRLLLQQVGIEQEIDLEVVDGAIVLRPARQNPREDWNQQFQQAIKNGHEPENDLFDGISNDFDQAEWQW